MQTSTLTEMCEWTVIWLLMTYVGLTVSVSTSDPTAVESLVLFLARQRHQPTVRCIKEILH